MIDPQVLILIALALVAAVGRLLYIDLKQCRMIRRRLRRLHKAAHDFRTDRPNGAYNAIAAEHRHRHP